MTSSILDIFGWLAIAGGVVFIIRSLLLNTHLRAEDHSPNRRPQVGLSAEGKKLLFRGILFVILGHILKDVLPSFVDQLPGA